MLLYRKKNNCRVLKISREVYKRQNIDRQEKNKCYMLPIKFNFVEVVGGEWLFALIANFIWAYQGFNAFGVL